MKNITKKMKVENRMDPIKAKLGETVMSYFQRLWNEFHKNQQRPIMGEFNEYKIEIRDDREKREEQL